MMCVMNFTLLEIANALIIFCKGGSFLLSFLSSFDFLYSEILSSMKMFWRTMWKNSNLPYFIFSLQYASVDFFLSVFFVSHKCVWVQGIIKAELCSLYVKRKAPKICQKQENKLQVQLEFSTLLYNLCIYNIFCKISYLSIWWISDRKRMGILVDICKSHFLIKEDLNNLLPPVSSYRLYLAAHIHMTHTRLYLGYRGK